MKFSGWVLFGLFSVTASATVESYHCEKGGSETQPLIAADITLDPETLMMSLDKLTDTKMKLRGVASEVTFENGNKSYLMAASEYPIRIAPTLVKIKNTVSLEFVNGATRMPCEPRF